MDTTINENNGPVGVETGESNNGHPLLRADTVYLYMGSEARVSRSTRAQWLLEHLDNVITIPAIESLDKIDKIIEVVSIIPEELVGGSVSWGPDTARQFQYYIHPHTKLLFLSRRYCLVYCLDMSPSLSAVDVQNSEVMADKVLTCLKTSLEGVSKSFLLPGSHLVFHPEIYVTIIANTPFFTTPAQQVLVQGWRVSSDNLIDLFSNIQAELLKLENAVVEVYDLYVDQQEARRIMFDKLVGGLFEEEPNITQSPSVAMVNPDQGFINMLRFGMLALRLLPASSCGSIIVVTDGVITLPDAHLLEATLHRFRTTGVCCSFLHVGSPYHPHGAQARVPYSDLMQFVANASLGSHITNIPATTILDFRDLQMNEYHKAFLSWSFQSFDKFRYESSCKNQINRGQWSVDNPYFRSSEDCPLLRKKQLEDTLNVPLVKILCCRVREGYVIKNINLSETQIKIKLLLTWKCQVTLEYSIRSSWPSSTLPIYFTLFIKAPYDFLHDISCASKKPFESPFRQAVVNRLWNTLRTLTQSDHLLVHLHAQENNNAWCAIPETVRSGMPLFNVTSNVDAGSPIITTNDVSNPQFAQFWKPVSMLDPDAWHKWLHTHRIGLILRHDSPLPKNLHLSNSSGRFHVIQCRQAATTLQSFLRDISTFVLVDNQSFVKILPPDDQQASWFYIIRITSKPPCVVLNIAFPCGISSRTRLEIVLSLKSQLSDLSCPTSLSSKERRLLDSTKEHLPVSRTTSKVKCCLVLQKPVEKIFIRYERVPNRFDTVVFPDGTQPIISSKPLVSESGKAGYLVTTLSRYLHHKRWIWTAQCMPGAQFGDPSIAKILSTITKMRLEEGFSFCHSHAGVVNMLLEVQMHGNPDLGEEVSRCVIQYVVFPPHYSFDEVKTGVDGESDEEEAEGMSQIITESWVEPHCGFVAGGPPRRLYMELLPYNKVSDAIAKEDAFCISALLTFQQLSLMARNKTVAQPPMTDTTQFQDKVNVINNEVSIKDERIHSVQFLFNLFLILPSCRQAELLFSMPVQDLSNWQVKLVENKETVHPDAKNILLMELIFDQLSKLHDRELTLSREDSVRYVGHLHKRERGANVHPVPIPKSDEEGNDDVEKTPRWRCFVKAMTEEHIMLTFIPASYHDLKLMMVTSGDEPKPIKMLTLEDNNIADYLAWGQRDPSQGSFEHMEPHRCHSVSEHNKQVYHSTPTTEGQHRKLERSYRSLKSDSSPVAATGTPSSRDSLVETPPLESSDSSLQRVFSAMTKPFRVRASSLDTNLTRRQHLGHVTSLRTTSMEAKVWGRQASEVSMEQLDKSSNLDTTSEDIVSATSITDRDTLQDSNKVFRTIPLPIFIYDCPLNHLIDTIVYKDKI